MPEETVLPFRVAPDKTPHATRIRSTLITASLDALRRHGHFDRYQKLLPREERDVVLSCVAGVWLPIQVGIAHYTACDSLSLSADAIATMGSDVSERVQASFLATLAKLAKTAGVTPWTGLLQFQRLWDRVLDGGGVAVVKLGPKDARIDVVELPLIDIPYFHKAFRAFIVTGCQMFASRVYAHDARPRGRADWTSYRIAWA